MVKILKRVILTYEQMPAPKYVIARELADSTEPGPIKDLFEYLANEEAKHKEELKKLYYETVHSGGVIRAVGDPGGCFP